MIFFKHCKYYCYPLLSSHELRHSYPLLGILCTESDFLLIYFPSFFILLLSSLVRHQLADQKCWMKSVFFSSIKVVRCLTFVTHPTSQLLTGDSQCCQYKICYIIIAKSNKYLKEGFSFICQNYQCYDFLKFWRSFPLLYFVLYFRWA